jgi:hypothetical protein
MAYKYLTTARINSTIKKHNLEVVYTKGAGYFYFLDLTTGDQVGESVMVAKMHHLTIQQWRDAAAEARATAPLTSTEGGVTKEVAKKMQEAAAEVRKLVETWDDAVEATQEELAQA